MRDRQVSPQVDLVSRQQQVQSVAMLALLLKWQAAVGEAANVAPLHKILLHCGHRLMANFENFLNETVRPYHPDCSLKLCC